MMSTDHFSQLVMDLPQLGQFPRAELYSEPTQIERLRKLGETLGINLYIKRDDTLPLAMGGNKVRQLEFYLGEAVAQCADTILITGAIQSNFVRLCAAAARKLGMKPIVQLEKRVPKQSAAYNTSGNVLLLKMFGAEIVYFPEGNNEELADKNLDIIAQQILSKGGKPYVIHLGIDHPPIGGLGYVAAAVETTKQLSELDLTIDHIVVPTGSALTHAGFLAGMHALKVQTPVHGICVRRDAKLQFERVYKRTTDIVAMIGSCGLGHDQILVHDETLEPGYGQMNHAVSKAVKLAAIQEGILLDPVYSGRTFAGLIELVESKKIQPGATVLFIHTGGQPANFGYQDDLEASVI